MAMRPRLGRWLVWPIGLALLTLGNGLAWIAIDNHSWGATKLRHSQPIAALGFSADNRRLVTTSLDVIKTRGPFPTFRVGVRGPTCQWWDLENNQMLETVVLKEEPTAIYPDKPRLDLVVLSPDGNRCLCSTGRVDGAGVRHNESCMIALDRQSTPLRWPSRLKKAAFSDDGKWAVTLHLLANRAGHQARLIDAIACKESPLVEATDPTSRCEGVWISPDGRLVAKAIVNDKALGEIVVFERESGRDVIRLNGQCEDLAFGVRNPWIAVARSTCVELIDYKLRKVLFKLNTDQPPTRVQFNVDETCLAASGHPVYLGGPIESFRIEPDRLMWAPMHAWETATGKLVANKEADGSTHFLRNSNVDRSSVIECCLTTFEGTKLHDWDKTRKVSLGRVLVKADSLSPDGEYWFTAKSNLPLGGFPLQLAAMLKINQTVLPDFLTQPNFCPLVVETFTQKPVLSLPELNHSRGSHRVLFSPDSRKLAILSTEDVNAVTVVNMGAADRPRWIARAGLAIANLLAFVGLIVTRRRRKRNLGNAPGISTAIELEQSTD